MQSHIAFFLKTVADIWPTKKWDIFSRQGVEKFQGDYEINIERSFDPTAGEVDLFPQEIMRALLNLISNGFYAATKRKEQDDSDGCEPTPQPMRARSFEIARLLT